MSWWSRVVTKHYYATQSTAGFFTQRKTHKYGSYEKEGNWLSFSNFWNFTKTSLLIRPNSPHWHLPLAFLTAYSGAVACLISSAPVRRQQADSHFCMFWAPFRFRSRTYLQVLPRGRRQEFSASVLIRKFVCLFCINQLVKPRRRKWIMFCSLLSLTFACCWV